MIGSSARLIGCLVVLIAGSLRLPFAGEPEPPASAANPPHGLQGTEGVVVQTMCTNCNSANIDLGGLGGELLPIDVDGFPLVGGLMTIYALQVDGALVDNIAVSKGPGDHEAPAEAIGGWIHVTTPPSHRRKLVDATLESGSFGWRSGQVRSSWSNTHWMVGGQFVRAESDAVDANGDRFNETGELDRSMWRLEGRYSAGSTWLTAKAYGIEEDGPDGHGKYFAPSFGSKDPGRYGREDAFVDGQGLQLGGEVAVGENGRLSLRAMSFDRLHRTLDQSVSPDQERLDPVFTIDERHRTVELRYGHFDAVRGRQLSGGLSWREQTDDVNAWQQTDPELIDVRDSWRNEGADAGGSWQLGPRWNLKAGVRYDRFRWSDETARTGLLEREDSALSPRLRIGFKPNDAWQLGFAIGSGARAPRPIYEEVCCGQRLSPTNNVALERSRAIALDIVWQRSAALKLGLYLHRTELDDHILRMVGTSLLGIQTYALGNLPEAVYQGATLTSRVRLAGGFTADLSYTQLDTENSAGPAVVFHFLPIGPSQIYRHEIPFDDVPYSAERAGTVQLGWADPRGRFDATVQAQFQGAVPIQEWYSEFEDVTNGNCSLSTPSGVDPQLCLKDGSGRSESFWVVGARFGVRAKPWLRLFGGVDNLTDTVQNDLYDPRNDYNWGPIRGRYFYLGMTIQI